MEGEGRLVMDEQSEQLQASKELIDYEYRIEETPVYKVVREDWELVDVLPKREGDRYFYVLVFRQPRQRKQ